MTKADCQPHRSVDVQPMNVDFLSLNPEDPKFKNVSHSKSGSPISPFTSLTHSICSDSSRRPFLFRFRYPFASRPPSPDRTRFRESLSSQSSLEFPTRDPLPRSPILGCETGRVQYVLDLGTRGRRSRYEDFGQEGTESDGLEARVEGTSFTDLGEARKGRGLWR